jgi:hypothetical protein
VSDTIDKFDLNWNKEMIIKYAFYGFFAGVLAGLLGN